MFYWLLLQYCAFIEYNVHEYLKQFGCDAVLSDRTVVVQFCLGRSTLVDGADEAEGPGLRPFFIHDTLLNKKRTALGSSRPHSEESQRGCSSGLQRYQTRR